MSCRVARTPIAASANKPVTATAFSGGLGPTQATMPPRKPNQRSGSPAPRTMRLILPIMFPRKPLQSSIAAVQVLPSASAAQPDRMWRKPLLSVACRSETINHRSQLTPTFGEGTARIPRNRSIPSLFTTRLARATHMEPVCPVPVNALQSRCQTAQNIAGRVNRSCLGCSSPLTATSATGSGWIAEPAIAVPLRRAPPSAAHD